jgi:hypothetical protein
MIGSSKRCTSVTKPIQLQSNLHGLNSLKLINQVLQLLHQLHLRQQNQLLRVEHHLFRKLRKKLLHQRPLFKPHLLLLPCKPHLRLLRKRLLLLLHKPHLLSLHLLSLHLRLRLRLPRKRKLNQHLY